MSAIFKIDQPTAVPPVVGIWDRASRNVQLAGGGVGPVVFTAQDVMISYLWELISEPPGPPTPIVGANLQSCQVSFTKTGGYLMRLTVDAGIPGSEDVSVRYVGIRLTNSGLPIPAFNELDFDNSIAPFTGTLGSSEKLTEFFKWLDAHIGGATGDLPITRTIYVDGARTDVYVETGSFGHPFKTITAAIAYIGTLPPAEYCLHIRPFKYDEVNVELPANVHVDAELGAELAPTVPSDGLRIIPGPIPPHMGVTLIRGLMVAGFGFGAWGLRIYNPHGAPFVPTVAFLDGGIGGYNQANLVLVEAGFIYFPDSGGSYGDGTNDIGIATIPTVPSPFNALALVGAWNLSANQHAFKIGSGGAIFANGPRVEVNVPPATGAAVYIDGGAGPTPGALFQGINLRIESDWQHVVEEHGAALVQINSMDGVAPSLGISCRNDIFKIHAGYLLMSGGSYDTHDGRGFALLADEGPVQCQIRDVDLLADPGGTSTGYLIETANTVLFETYNCRFRGSLTPGRSYTHLAHTAGAVYLDGGVLQGGSGGGPVATLLDLVSGITWLTGGMDINANQWTDIAINVQAGATVAHGHANVRVGQVILGGAELPLTSSFAGINLGKYNAITKWTSRATLAELAGEDGYEHGSIVVVTGGVKPLVYINHGTNIARDWRLLSDYSRIQVDLCGAVNLNGTTRAVPSYLVWGNDDYNDSPPYTFTAPSSVITLSEDGDYRLSHHVPWQTDALLAFGSSIGVMWEYKPPGGAWTEIVNTMSLDTAANVVNDRGANDLPPYEMAFVAGTELRVKAFIVGANGNIYINNNPAENWSWARIEKGGVGASGGGGGPGTDWVTEFVTVNRVLDATDHKKNLVVLVDSPNTVTITLPLTPFIGQEVRIVHGGPLSFPGPGSGHLTISKANAGDKGIGLADDDYDQLDSDGGGSVVHLSCVDGGGGYWSSRFWGCVSGSGLWWDASHLGTSWPPLGPFESNQFYVNFQSPFRSGLGGAGAIQLNEAQCYSNAPFSFVFGQHAYSNKSFSLVFGQFACSFWTGEEVYASGGPFGYGSAQKSSINLWGETPYGVDADITPTGSVPFALLPEPLTMSDNRVYACELLVVAAECPHVLAGPPIASSWKMEFLVHGMGGGESAVIVGSINKNQFSRDPAPIIDAWDVTVSIGGPGPVQKDILVTVTPGPAGPPGTVRWDAVLSMAQISVEEMPT